MSEPIGPGILDGVVRFEEDHDHPKSAWNNIVLKPVDTIGSAIDTLNAGIAMVNAASERMKAFGLTPQIYVNGHDYGDKVSVRLDGDLVR